jgi:hypothetical protein
MERASDVRSLPDGTLNLFLYAHVAWGVGLLGLWFGGYAAWAIPATFAVAIWQAGVTALWGARMMARFDRGEFTRPEADAGVASVARILGASSVLPAVVFFAQDPLSPAGWGVSVAVAVVAAAVYTAAPLVVRFSNRWTHTLVLAAAVCALPLNATGAVSVANAVGWFDRLAS